MTYNIFTGGRDGDDGRRLSRVCEQITEVSPDVLVLQECNGFEQRGSEALYQVERATGLRGVLAPASTGFHVGLFVRALGDAVRGVPPIALVSTQRLDAEVYHAVIAARLDVGGLGFTVVGAHLCPFGGHNRLGEVPHLIRFLRGGPCFVMGDLNALSRDDVDRYSVDAWLPRRRSRHVDENGRLDTRAIDALRAAGLVDLFAGGAGSERFVPTAQTSLCAGHESYQVRIDYVLSDAISAECVTGKACVRGPLAETASDHYALWVDVDCESIKAKF